MSGGMRVQGDLDAGPAEYCREPSRVICGHDRILQARGNEHTFAGKIGDLYGLKHNHRPQQYRPGEGLRPQQQRRGGRNRAGHETVMIGEVHGEKGGDGPPGRAHYASGAPNKLSCREVRCIISAICSDGRSLFTSDTRHCQSAGIPHRLQTGSYNMKRTYRTRHSLSLGRAAWISARWGSR